MGLDEKKAKEEPTAAMKSEASVSLLKRISSKKKKREQIRKEAKEQEEKYVQFRKEELFAKTRISSHGRLGVSYTRTPSLRMAQFSDSEDKFPAPKMGTGMDFGVYKAHLLNKKPNPKYATWPGKTAKDGHYIGLDIGEYLARFRATEGERKDRPPIDPEKERVRIRHGAFEDQPLTEDGEPVWSSESDEDLPSDKDDILVNCETIEEAVLNPKMLDFPVSEQKFSWDDDYEELKKQANTRDEVVKNTLRSVVKLAMPETLFVGNNKSSYEKTNLEKMKWSADVFEYKYNRDDVPCNIQPKREKKALKNVVKTKKEKKE